jgi:aminoglycoside phosphotransferase (APT) family kinase protein
MRYNTDMLHETLDNLPIGTVQLLDELPAGNSSHATKITTDTGLFVALQPRSDQAEKPDYPYQHAVLTSLEQAGYPYAPRAVYADPELLVTTFAEGNVFETVAKESPEVQKQAMLTLAGALLTTRTVSVESYKEACQAAQVSPRFSSPQRDFQTFALDRFQEAQRYVPAHPVASWLEPRIAACQRLFPEAPENTNDTGMLSHGDPNQHNILIADGHKLTLIDWEHARFIQHLPEWADFDLGYLFIHTPLTRPFRDDMVRHVAAQAAVPVPILETAIRNHTQVTRLGDVIWAYMKYAQTAATHVDKAGTYLKLAAERMALYDAEF